MILGGAASPRLFSGADSADVFFAAEYLSVKRPWGLLLAVGWGTGGAMLVKHLGQAGDETPLAAAVSVGNPWDAGEASENLARPRHKERNANVVAAWREVLERNEVGGWGGGGEVVPFMSVC